MEKERIPIIEKRAETIDYYIKRFSSKRYDFIDDLPKNYLLPDDPNFNKYKCRSIWWHYLLGDLEGLLFEHPSLSEDVTNKVEEFKTFIKNIDRDKFRTKEEIDKANNFLEELIADLEKEKIK